MPLSQRPVTLWRYGGPSSGVAFWMSRFAAVGFVEKGWGKFQVRDKIGLKILNHEKLAWKGFVNGKIPLRMSRKLSWYLTCSQCLFKGKEENMKLLILSSEFWRVGQKNDRHEAFFKDSR